jgi:membrane protein
MSDDRLHDLAVGQRHDWLKRLGAITRRWTALPYGVGRRFIEDRCLTGASALSYATIVSMVPLTAIVLTTFSGFPIFSGARTRFLSIIVNNFAPDIGGEAVAMFTSFASNAAQTTALGVAALIVTSILLLATIEEHLHFIFRVIIPRPWGQRVLAYWTVLTLGPVLLGVGLSLSGNVDALIHTLGFDGALTGNAARIWSADLRWLTSVVLETFAISLLYILIPNRAIVWRDCFIGGAVAAVLLELLKFFFSMFIARMSTYSMVYGALAGIPIFLLWMYIFWGTVLLGAEIAAYLNETREAAMAPIEPIASQDRKTPSP